ncbi:MAG: MFS transporter [Phycicoccus sp.]
MNQTIRSLLPDPGDKRTYVISSMISGIGGGILMPISILYFTRIVGIEEAQVGLAFMISGLLAIPLSVPAGDLADRIGPRSVALAGLVGLGCAGIGLLFVRDFWSLVVVDSIITFSLAVHIPSAGAVMRRVAGDETVTLRSQVRVMANVGVALGTLIAGIGIQFDSTVAYRILLILFAVAQFSSVLLFLRLPKLPPLHRTQQDSAKISEPRWIALRDLPFVGYTLVGGAMMVQGLLLEILIPVWIVSYTDAPAWGVTVAFIVNTLMVVLLQVKFGNRVQTLKDGGAALRKAGVVLMLGCLALSLMKGAPPWAAFLLLVLGIALLTLGEIWHASGTYTFEFELPPAFAQGQYQGLSTTTSGIARAAAPALLLGIALNFGEVGWIGIGIVLMALGLLGPALARWGARTRRTAAEAASSEVERSMENMASTDARD